MKWRKQLAVILTVALTGNMGVISPLASGSGEDVREIEKIAELSKEVLTQKVSWGTTEQELKLPKTLKVMLEVPEDDEDEAPAEKASGSNVSRTEKKSSQKKSSWEEVEVTWSLTEADNGLTAYDGETPGVYTFEAKLADEQYEADSALFPVITVEVEGEAETEEIIDMVFDLGKAETSVMASFFSMKDGKVELASGEHERWIDRIDVPDYVVEFYETLEEMADGDGYEDMLIDDSYFLSSNAIQASSTTFNGIPVTKLSTTSDISDEEWEYISNCLTAAVCAFDRDHPEVFWLNDLGRMYLTGIGNSSGYTYTVYFMYKVHQSDDGQLYDIRKPEYRTESAIKKDIERRDQAVSRITKDVSSDNAVDQVIHFNDWLTKNNEYNTKVANGSSSGVTLSAWECISALVGSEGVNGPVCEGYARAFKVLCDEVGIPCVLVDGDVTGGGHMWNYAEIEGEWYAVDVTWNDPTGGKSGKVSGFERTDWLLLGSESPVKDNNRDKTFIESHPVANSPSSGFAFPNGPSLSEDRYPIAVPTVTFSTTAKTVTYTGKQAEIDAPVVELEDSNGGKPTQVTNPTITYSYKKSGASGYVDGLPVDAGVYDIRAHVASSKTGGVYGSV